MGRLWLPIACRIRLMINQMLFVPIFIGSYGEPILFRDCFGSWFIHLSLAPGQKLGGVVIGGWGCGGDKIIREDASRLSHHLKYITMLLRSWDDGFTGRDDSFGLCE
jgi:hypothetical protein